METGLELKVGSKVYIESLEFVAIVYFNDGSKLRPWWVVTTSGVFCMDGSDLKVLGDCGPILDQEHPLLQVLEGNSVVGFHSQRHIQEVYHSYYVEHRSIGGARD
jgi:hypothetical protein